MSSTETSDDLVPLHHEGGEQSGFARVLRGYDPRQVDDYLDRVEVALNEADERHADDGSRIAALERQVGELGSRVQDAERRASGQPEPASLVGERITKMLALAEEEATALRDGARREAEQLLTTAKQAAARETAQRTSVLEKREREVAAAAAESDQLRLQAQKDAEAVRSRAQRDAQNELSSAQREADNLRGAAKRDVDTMITQARHDVRGLHEQARAEAAALAAEARRQVDLLAEQRDAIAAQLQSLRDAVSAAVAPLGGPTAQPPVQGHHGGGSARVQRGG